MCGSHDLVIVQPLLPPVRNPADVRAGPKRGEEEKGLVSAVHTCGVTPLLPHTIDIL